MTKERFLEQKNWEDYWDRLSLPAEYKKTKISLYLNEILKILKD